MKKSRTRPTPPPRGTVVLTSEQLAAIAGGKGGKNFGQNNVPY